MWSEYGSPNFARRAKDQAVVLHKESVLRLLGLLSQRDQYPFLWLQSPILVPQAVGALTSPCCPPRSLSLRVSPFPQCLSSLWALPYIQIEVHALPRSLGGAEEGDSWRENPRIFTRVLGLSSSFTKKGIENTRGLGQGVVGGKVKFNDALDFNPHITYYFVLK